MWEGLLGFNFQRSQDNIEFWTVLSSILEGFGLHFGRALGSKSEKKAFKTGQKDKRKKSTKTKGPEPLGSRGSAEWREPVGEHFARTKWTSHALLPLEASSKTGAADRIALAG